MAVRASICCPRWCNATFQQWLVRWNGSIDTARSSKSSSMQIFQGVPSGDTAPSVKFVTLDELVHVSKPAIRARRNRVARLFRRGENRGIVYALVYAAECCFVWKKKRKKKKKQAQAFLLAWVRSWQLRLFQSYTVHIWCCGAFFGTRRYNWSEKCGEE